MSSTALLELHTNEGKGPRAFLLPVWWAIIRWHQLVVEAPTIPPGRRFSNVVFKSQSDVNGPFPRGHRRDPRRIRTLNLLSSLETATWKRVCIERFTFSCLCGSIHPMFSCIGEVDCLATLTSPFFLSPLSAKSPTISNHYTRFQFQSQELFSSPIPRIWKKSLCVKPVY